MQLSGPNPVTFVPPAAQVVVDSVTFDLNQHRFTLAYRDNGGITQKVVTGAIPGALLTALEAQVQKAIETNENWAAGSSTVVAT